MAVRAHKPAHQRPQPHPQVSPGVPHFVQEPPKAIERRVVRCSQNAQAKSSVSIDSDKPKMILRLRIRSLSYGRKDSSVRQDPRTPGHRRPGRRRQPRHMLSTQHAVRLGWIRRLRSNSRRRFLLEHH
ncbi:hypothetical protein N7540_012947 [Penicillium herquei]|nr:hypothetical protein N7540_013253 [Penicillium herquei]KAJ6003821.1 hypothetical protein N7540_013103 [Penicillium herquei]KAJ6004578.1 hypothetical protein N7540_012947 [Penicillium herquei]